MFIMFRGPRHFQGAVSIGRVERKHNSTLEPPEICKK